MPWPIRSGVDSPRFKHGMARTPTYVSWQHALARCYNPNRREYYRYGGRGITVCDRWNPKAGGSFINFLEDMGVKADGMTLDRIDNDGNYEPGNCRWATIKEQANNRGGCCVHCSLRVQT